MAAAIIGAMGAIGAVDVALELSLMLIAGDALTGIGAISNPTKSEPEYATPSAPVLSEEALEIN
jgi:hypothetical protein